MIASIVIPAYRPASLLESCLRSLVTNTDKDLIEIIVVCNGSDRESADLILNNYPDVKLVWYKEALGFVDATNIGIKLAKGPITILVNTDTMILDYAPRNQWLDRLIQPFDDPAVGIVGLSTMNIGWSDFYPFYFVAIKSEIFDKIGYLDPAFSPGYGEDLDFCIRAKLANYRLANVDVVNSALDNRFNFSDYPLYHPGEGSFTDSEKRHQYLENSYKILTAKYGERNF